MPVQREGGVLQISWQGSIQLPSLSVASRIAMSFFLILAAVGCKGQLEKDTAYEPATQPSADVTTKPTINSTNPSPTAVSVAKAFVQPLVAAGKIEPDPVRITEGADHWNMWFRYRQVVTEKHGRKIIRMQLPSVLNVEVDKNDLSARFIPNR